MGKKDNKGNEPIIHRKENERKKTRMSLRICFTPPASQRWRMEQVGLKTSLKEQVLMRLQESFLREIKIEETERKTNTKT